VCPLAACLLFVYFEFEKFLFDNNKSYADLLKCVQQQIKTIKELFLYSIVCVCVISITQILSSFALKPQSPTTMDHYFNQLTQGAIGHILNNVKIENPVFQMLAYKNMPTENQVRYRLVVSDGAYTYQCCIIMGDLALKVEKGEFDRFCLLKINRYMLNEIQNRQVIVLADPKLIVSGSQVGGKLGSPVAWDSADAPPLSNFIPNYHLNAQTNSMDVEFENDPFGDVDSAPMNKFSANNVSNSAKKHKNNYGQVSSRQTNQMSNTLNPQLACPISSITPYSNKWLIKGRVTSKTNKRTWNNAKGEGVLFAFDIKDDSGDIRMTAFKAECEKFFDMIKVDDVVLVSRGQVKPANKQFTRTSSEYEITLNQESIIEVCNDQTGCPNVSYDFKNLESMQEYFGGFVDIIAIIKQVNDVDTIIQKKTNKELLKRSLIIVDSSKTEVELTIWGEEALSFKGEIEDVIVIRGVKVSDFNGVSLSTTTNSTVEINPALEEVYALKSWYNRVKDNLQTNSLTTKMSGAFRADWNQLSEITPENASQENGIVMQTKATIYQMGKPNMYKACEIVGCNKKLIDTGNGFYRCEKCAKDTNRYQWRLIMTFGIADHSKNVWVQAFPDQTIKLVGDRDINELGELSLSDTNKLDEILRTINFSSYIFKLRARMEHFNDEARVRTQVAGVAPINYQEYAGYMLNKIRED